MSNYPGKKRKIQAGAFVPIVLALHTAYASAEESESQPASIFQLGEIDVRATRLSTLPDGSSGTVITRQNMLENSALDIGQALGNVTGVTPTFTGQRAETQVYIRGFNAQQITLNIDGIPIYVPYDGNVDLSRLQTQGISRIEVTKGLGSLMYGPNNMGGSINIITSAPTSAFEGSLTGGLAAKDKLYGSNGGVQLGGRLNAKWYLQGGITVNDTSGFPLSGNFTAVAAQPAGDRLRAASRDSNDNLKIGFTPNATDEYALGYYAVNSSKQSPPYTGNTTLTGQRVAYWDWPQWDKQSYYFIGHTAVGEGYLKTRLYRDNFTNRLDSYDNSGYATVTKPFAFLSEYKDHSIGGSVEAGQPIGEKNFLKLAAFYKDDVHNEFSTNYNTGKHALVTGPWLQFKANTESLGLEDTYSETPLTKLILAYRYDRHQFGEAQQSVSNVATSMTLAPAVSANNAQIKLTHVYNDMLWRAGVGLQTRFPGIKDVYSYRLGQGIPNPALGPEHALNREVGMFSKLPGGGDYDVALYWDSIRNAIEFVTVSPGLGQNQNVGTASNRGLDMTLHLPLAEQWKLTVNYSYLDSVLGTPGLAAVNAPHNSGNATLSWLESEHTEFTADLQAASRRQTSTNGRQPAAGYALANLRVTEHFDKKASLSAGIYNLFDRNYALTEGFPMPGRTVRAELSYLF